VKKAALYIRSNEQPARKGRNQNFELIFSCEKEGFKPVQIYIDTECSSMNLERPSLQSLIRNLDKRYFDWVVVENIARLSRNTNDLFTLMRLFRKNGIKLFSMEGAIECELPSIQG
jgi:DNA invertase Pin-like site-specific DNA recombinase